MSTVVATVTLSANTQPDEKTLVNYVKSTVVKNPKVKINGVTVVEATTHKDLKDWTILLTTMDLVYNGKEIHAPETMFVKDGMITGQLTNLKTGLNYRESIKPSLPDSYYNDAHLLFGNKDAKHKVLIFSDPQCPFCQTLVPEIFKVAKDNPSQVAIYYYHLPLLNIHPVSDILTRIMHVAQDEGKMDVIEKMYSLKINAKETNITKIISAVKSHTGYSVSAESINAKSVIDALKSDEMSASRMMVQGTPTIYIDGKWDKSRNGYKALAK
ncbi:Secreted protein, suppressor for copper-sensitivity ScsC [hydrothermal vent metagenome]|uniref:Secreted protein, suppressor for copper-sensitivity ScsC n=1 Tax=hydrothermal vent metagenome TaxID=652676 RepID=A0A1W1CV30_9ZZZZ